MLIDYLLDQGAQTAFDGFRPVNLQRRRLRGDEVAGEVDVEVAAELRDRQVLERARLADAGAVDHGVEAAQHLRHATAELMQRLATLTQQAAARCGAGAAQKGSLA